MRREGREKDRPRRKGTKIETKEREGQRMKGKEKRYTEKGGMKGGQKTEG